jgi:hypothetical protein
MRWWKPGDNDGGATDLNRCHLSISTEGLGGGGSRPSALRKDGHDKGPHSLAPLRSQNT